MPEILMIDDDQSLSSLLCEFLSGQGYATRCADNGRIGLREMYERKPDLIILDVTMPQMDGWETLKRIREMSDTPVIMLTARDDESNILRGFSIGADDYVTKPFSFAQLSARIKAVLARKGGGPSGEHLVSGGLEVDIPSRRVTRGGETISLTPTEFNLLSALMRRQGEAMSSEELARQVWGPQYASEVGFVRRYIWHLRQKVELDPEKPEYIHNERGFGYRFGNQESK
ncbi:MAG: response regulator transcription factor [Anaerolineales bacterium]|nr:response regulator transcription factor [Anaerolineales bacterium]